MLGLTTGIMVLFSMTTPLAANINSAAISDGVVQEITTVSAAVTPITIETYVRNYFSDTPVLAEIARCESTFRQNGSDGKVLRGDVDSRDLGLAQINTHYWGKTAESLGFDLHTIDGNLAMAEFIYKKYGTAPWNASKPCWGKKATALARS